MTEVVLLIMLLPDDSDLPRSELDIIDYLEELTLELLVFTFLLENLSFVVRFRQKFFK